MTILFVSFRPSIIQAILVVFVLFLTTTTALSAQEEDRITLEELQLVDPFPEEYEVMTHEARLDWLNSQLETDLGPALRYNITRALTLEYYSQYKNLEVQEFCKSNPPLSFDLRYRFVCIMTSDVSYDERITSFLDLYEASIAADDKQIIAQTLVSMGWYQSGNGDIALAFKSLEEALSMGEHLDFFALNDAMVNTASLYIVHGDKEYVRKGIELHKQSIERLKQKGKEDPEFADFVTNSILIPQFNIGVAYALHLYDYEQALHWFKIVNRSQTQLPHLRLSSIIFAAMSAAELGRDQEAEQLLARSYDEPQINNTEFSYLICYRELVKHQLNQNADLSSCLPLHKNVPLEVKIDVYKRISELDDEALSNAGQGQFYDLFVDKLEGKLKQSSTSAASTTELHRQQQESRLRNELLEKEIALKTAQQEKRDGQVRFMAAALLSLLLLVVITVIRLRQKRRLAEQYEELSVLDVLTGLKNRRFLEQNIGREMSYVKRSQVNGDGHTLGVYLLDIDHFKPVNDNFGHEAGDRILVEFVRRINEAIRDTDIFVRWGGEEFLLVARLDQADGLQVLAERIIQAVKQQPYQASENRYIDLTCTIGSVIYPFVKDSERDVAWNKLVQLADLALYYGKNKQRDCWVCIESMTEREHLNAILNQPFEQSLENKQLTISTSIES